MLIRAVFPLVSHFLSKPMNLLLMILLVEKSNQQECNQQEIGGKNEQFRTRLGDDVVPDLPG
jgi:hypothetical protein